MVNEEYSLALKKVRSSLSKLDRVVLVDENFLSTMPKLLQEAIINLESLETLNNGSASRIAKANSIKIQIENISQKINQASLLYNRDKEKGRALRLEVIYSLKSIRTRWHLPNESINQLAKEVDDAISLIESLDPRSEDCFKLREEDGIYHHHVYLYLRASDKRQKFSELSLNEWRKLIRRVEYREKIYNIFQSQSQGYRDKVTQAMANTEIEPISITQPTTQIESSIENQVDVSQRVPEILALLESNPPGLYLSHIAQHMNVDSSDLYRFLRKNGRRLQIGQNEKRLWKILSDEELAFIDKEQRKWELKRKREKEKRAQIRKDNYKDKLVSVIMDCLHIEERAAHCIWDKEELTEWLENEKSFWKNIEKYRAIDEETAEESETLIKKYQTNHALAMQNASIPEYNRIVLQYYKRHKKRE